MADPVLAFQDHAKLVEVRCFRLCHRCYARKERERGQPIAYKKEP